MRRTITVAVAALLALPLAACGDDGGSTGTGTGSGDAAKPITYGIPSPLATEPGEHNINLGITCYAEKTGGKVITLDSNLDVNKQISDFDNLLAQGATVLPFLPLDQKAFTAPFQRAKDAGAIVVELYNPNSTAPGSVFEDSPAAGKDDHQRANDEPDQQSFENLASVLSVSPGAAGSAHAERPPSSATGASAALARAMARNTSSIVRRP